MKKQREGREEGRKEGRHEGMNAEAKEGRQEAKWTQHCEINQYFVHILSSLLSGFR